MGDKIITVLGTIVVLGIVTTLVLPNRKTAEVVRAGGGAFIGALNAAMGR
jgi:hypothetical protein